jgi:hypothetical protein
VVGLTKAEAQDIITQYTGVSVDKQDASFKKFRGLPRSQQKALVQEALGDLYAALESSPMTSGFDRQPLDCDFIGPDIRNPIGCPLTRLINVYG